MDLCPGPVRSVHWCRTRPDPLTTGKRKMNRRRAAIFPPLAVRTRPVRRRLTVIGWVGPLSDGYFARKADGRDGLCVCPTTSARWFVDSSSPQDLFFQPERPGLFLETCVSLTVPVPTGNGIHFWSLPCRTVPYLTVP